MELEKFVKERVELKVKIEKWEESSKSLNKILNSQMSANDKNGLGYDILLNEINNKYETDSEISMSIFKARSSDEEITPANDRFSKADGYHTVPPPITGNFLTPRADISFAGLDEYAIRKKIIESKTNELNTDTSKSKTRETIGKTNEVNIEKPKSVYESVVPKPKINRDKVIIEDWNSNDEDDVSEVNTVNPVKTKETTTVKTQVDKIGQISQKEGIGFKKIKGCFVCKSTNHLIKDCYFYAKKSLKPKLETMANTGQRVVKPVWDNAKRVNHQKISNKLKYPQTRRTFVPKGVLTKPSLINPFRPNRKRAVHTVSTARPVGTPRPFEKRAQTGSAIRPIYLRMDNVRPRASYLPIKRSYYTKPAFRPKNLKQDVKTSRVKNMTTVGTRVVVNTSNALKKSRTMKITNGGVVALESDPKRSKIRNCYTPWKFIILNILPASPKSGGWDQFGSNIATALICLSSNRVYNFSKMIFDGMVHNLESNTKFLMYPRFLQIILDITTENNGKYLAPTLTKKIFGNMKRGFAGEHVPLLPAMLAGAAPDQGEGSAIPAGSQPTPDPVPSITTPPPISEPQPSSPPRSIPRQGTEIPQSQGPTVTPVADEATTTGVGVETEGATTTTSGLDAGMDSGNIHESPLRSHEAPLPEGNTSGSAEDSLNLKELMDIVPKLVLRIDNLEKELQQTKSTYGKAVLTLVERVKLLEAALKRKSMKVILSESEDEETEDSGGIFKI
ncbi:hypothetical protein Tco_0488196 [Tanacetum coccineum]